MTDRDSGPTSFQALYSALSGFALKEGKVSRQQKEQLGALLTEAEAFLAQGRQGGRYPTLRSIHHFACSGGTLLSKCVGAMPCVRLLSEVDPFSEMGHRQSFLPTDLIGLAKLGTAPPGRGTVARIFMSGLAALVADSRAEGRDLILRDHTHSHYCHGVIDKERPTLQALLRESYDLLSLVTVRHPLDSYMSLARQNWLHFEPKTLEEYCRRYMLFLDHYEGTDIIRYEDFVAAPEQKMQEICDSLRLSYNPNFKVLFSALYLSGDSGRGGSEIRQLPRREVSQSVKREIENAPTYESLCGRLEYDPA